MGTKTNPMDAGKIRRRTIIVLNLKIFVQGEMFSIVPYKISFVIRLSQTCTCAMNYFVKHNMSRYVAMISLKQWFQDRFRGVYT